MILSATSYHYGKCNITFPKSGFLKLAGDRNKRLIGAKCNNTGILFLTHAKRFAYNWRMKQSGPPSSYELPSRPKNQRRMTSHGFYSKR